MLLGLAFLLLKEGGSLLVGLSVDLFDILQSVLLFLVDGSLSIIDLLASLSVLLLQLIGVLKSLLTLLLGSLQFLPDFVQSDRRCLCS